VALSSLSTPDTFCGTCQLHPPPYDRVLAPFRYESPLNHLIHRLKYNGRLEQARLLGDLMAEWLEGRLDPLPDRVIPVPLHPARLRQRGFNQAVELARRVCNRLQLPLDIQSCYRQKATLPQSEMADARARARNIKGAFLVRGEIRGTVAILDDVMTTGSTVGELAKCLRAAGAARIEVWAVARTNQ
jgi:ComF family protein